MPLGGLASLPRLSGRRSESSISWAALEKPPGQRSPIGGGGEGAREANSGGLAAWRFVGELWEGAPDYGRKSLPRVYLWRGILKKLSEEILDALSAIELATR